MMARVTGWMVATCVLALASEARAWCSPDHVGMPECDGNAGYNGQGTLSRKFRAVKNVCNLGEGVGTTIDVAAYYIDPVQIVAGDTLGVAAFKHGGGAHTYYWDNHGRAIGHPMNPYDQITASLVNKGLVVVHVISALHTVDPWVAADHVVEGLGCFRRATTSGQCITSGSGTPLCFNDLLDRVNWGGAGMSNLTYIGWSSGGIAGIYLPEKLRTNIRMYIFIDPAKHEWMSMIPMSMYTNAPLIHLYPDYYGPYNQALNNTFLLRNTLSGAWVPIGMRDYDMPGATDCNPDDFDGNPATDNGCHHSTHITAIDGYWSADPSGPSAHQALCDDDGPAPTDSSGIVCSSRRECGTSGTWCEVIKSLTTEGGIRAIQAPNATWSMEPRGSLEVLSRYVTAYAACLGAEDAGYFQPWVNGYKRSQDDGIACFGGTTSYPVPSPSCAAHASSSACTGAGCVWAGWGINAGRAECLRDAYTPFREPTCSSYTTSASCFSNPACTWAPTTRPAIRLNNGQVVTDYPHNNNRDYMTEPVASGGSAYNTTTGAFTEQTERLDATYPITCASGIGVR